MLNNVKSNFSFNEMNKKDLPAMYSTVFRCLLVVLLFFFWLYCITTVTPLKDEGSNSMQKSDKQTPKQSGIHRR